MDLCDFFFGLIETKNHPGFRLVGLHNKLCSKMEYGLTFVSEQDDLACFREHVP